MKKIFFILFLFSFSAVFALNCSVCKKTIKREYLKNDKGTVFCSKKCFASTAPQCTVCKKPCMRGAFTLNNKIYCSEKCINSIHKCTNCNRPDPRQMRILINSNGQKKMFCRSCANKPKCYYCIFPYKTSKLADGRHICRDCAGTAIYSAEIIRKKMRDIRRTLQRLFGFDPNHHIELIIVDLKQLAKESREAYKMEYGRRLALMRFEYIINEKNDLFGKKTTKMGRTKCRMFILSHTPSDLLEDAIAHELTHDFLRHNAGQYTDLSIEEGFAEAIAAEYNKYMKRPHLNKQKQNNPDPVYGGGYRKMSELLKKHGFRRTLDFIKKNSKPYL